MDLTVVKDLYRNTDKYLGKEITVGGWVRSIRDSKTFGFIVLNDGTFFETLQIVYNDKMENFAEISKLNDNQQENGTENNNSHLKFRQRKSALKVHQLLIIHFRRRDTQWSI